MIEVSIYFKKAEVRKKTTIQIQTYLTEKFIFLSLAIILSISIFPETA